jgi:hypothetical protein
MSKSFIVPLKLESVDVLQILDAVTDRAEAWEKTAAVLSGESFLDEFFIAEECSDADEAEKIAQSFRLIAETITQQLTKWQQETYALQE